MEEGWVIFDNIRKFVFYLFSCNLAEIFVLLGAGFVGVGPPLLPLQILWLNLITDTFPALAVEPGDRAVMRQPPRDPAEAILHGAMQSSIGMYAALIAAVTIVAHANAGTTGAFMTLALAQILHLGNARSAGPVLTPPFAFANRAALGRQSLPSASAAGRVPSSPCPGAEGRLAFDWSVGDGGTAGVDACGRGTADQAGQERGRCASAVVKRVSLEHHELFIRRGLPSASVQSQL